MTRLAPVLLSLFLASTSLAAGITKESLTSLGLERTYYLFVPPKLEGPAPLLILLHGSGRNGKIVLDHWRGMAEKEGIVLAGPDATESNHWQFPADGPVLLRDLVTEVEKRTAIDKRRIYLFGHSAGASFAVPMALLQSKYFAAVVAHAGGIQPGNEGGLDVALRKIPIALVVGLKDPAMANSRTSKELLEARGFPVELTEVPHHGHDYYARSKFINDLAWKFLAAHVLEADPVYTSYANIPEK